MKRLNYLIFFAFMLSIFSIKSYGVIAYPYPFQFMQPDGTTITIQLRGDEKVHWAVTMDGYTLLQNGNEGWEYAIINNNNDLICSGILAHEITARSSAETYLLSGVQNNLTYSSSQVAIMKAIWAQAQSSKSLQKAFMPTGSKNLLMILIGFTDKAFTKTQADFNGLMNQIGYNLNGAVGSVKDYYRETSYNQFDITTTVAGPYTAANNMAYYGANDGNGDDINVYELISEAVTLADPNVNYADFDNDADGTVDGVYVVYAGYGEASGAPSNTIWPHASSITTMYCDGKSISKYSCSNELRGTSGTNMTTIGVICHEFGHVCGAKDYYDTDYATNGQYPGTGEWDVMAGGSWGGIPGGNKPPHMNPYDKIRFNWATPVILTTDVSILMNDITTNPQIYRYNTTTANEYFLLENRQQTGFNGSAPGHGLMIFHVDGDYVNSHYNSNNINVGSHQGLHPMSAISTTANGIMLSSVENINDAGCPWPGTSNKTTFDDVTMPNAKSWLGNNTNGALINISENTSTHQVSFCFKSCPAINPVLVFAATTISASQINLGWQQNLANNDVIITYNTTNTFGTLTNNTVYNVNDAISGGGTILYKGSLLAFNHTGLTPQTTYYYQIRSMLSNNYSGINAANATTTCAAITSLPWIENFDGVTAPAIPSCMSVTNNNNDSKLWATKTGNSSYYRSSPNGMYVEYNSFMGMNDWFFSPAITLNPGIYKISFWYRVGSGYPEKLEVKWGTAANAGGMTGVQIFDNSNITNTTFVEGTGNFTVTSTGDYYIGWHGYSAVDQWYISIDDLKLEVLSSNSITTGTIASPVCQGATLNVPFTINGTYSAGNVFTAQLSNASGNFATPTNIGTISGTSAGTILATIPIAQTTGSAYRIRVISSIPAIIGINNSSNITINAMATPVFTALGPYCVNATPGILPASSTNGIAGTWSPSTISTASAGTTTYTFTPTTGLCATLATMPVTVNANVTPTFTQIGPYCMGATPETLPTSSNNGITGTWNPATISTASAGTTTYTFTPTTGLCATLATMTVTVNANVTPTFTQIGPYCMGATPETLPTSSNNGITGTWNPATISTASAGTTTYTFTPTTGLCATLATMPVTVNANVTPTFTQIGPYCMGATPETLPTSSNNGITGTWNPATISTASAGTTTYTFTPTTGLCATLATMTVTVNALMPVSVSISANPPGAQCPGTVITFTAAPINDGTSPVYVWTINGSPVGGNSPTYSSSTLTSGALVVCSLTSNANCATNNQATSNTITMVINPSLLASVGITAVNNPVCTGATVNFTASINNGGSSPLYQWYINTTPIGNNSTYSSNTLNDGDSVRCQLTSNEACVTNNPRWSNTIHMIVSPIPTAEAGANATYTGSPILIGNPANGSGTCNWSPATGLNNPNSCQPFALPTATTTYTLTVNNNGCISTDTVTINYGGSGYTISGKTRYIAKANAGNPVPNPPTYNSVIYNIDNVIVVLKSNQGGVELARDTSDAQGFYQFHNVADGNYMLSWDKYSVDTMQWGNSIDAIDLVLIKHVLGNDPLVNPSKFFSAKYMKAANVDNNAAINAIDVSRIQAKIGSPYNVAKNFPKGNWVALDTLITVAGSNVNINLKTICYGDYNASSSKYRNSEHSWSMAKALPENIVIVSDDYITISDSSYFEIPLSISTKMNEFSALGLELSYPGKSYKLVNAYMPQTNNKNVPVKINPTLEEIITNDNDLLVTDEDGVIRVVYATTNHFDVDAQDKLIWFGFRSLKTMNQGELEFNLNGTGVIGNKYGEKNEDAYLIMPKIFVQGNNNDAGFEFAGYPNPFNGEATLTYNIPENGTVRLKVYNAIGELVNELVNETQVRGKHSVVFSAKDLPAGMYTFKLEFSDPEKSKCMVLKLIH